MCSFETLEINLKAMLEDSQEIRQVLEDEFFSSLDDAEIHQGKVSLEALIRKVPNGDFTLSLTVDGMVTVPCDLCLDDMEQPIHGECSYIVKLGMEPSEDDEVIVVDENQGILSLPWIIYETIALAVPIKHVHAPGKCNAAMTEKLYELSATRSGDEASDASDGTADNGTIDPRWAKLTELK